MSCSDHMTCDITFTQACVSPQGSSFLSSEGKHGPSFTLLRFQACDVKLISDLLGLKCDMSSVSVCFNPSHVITL